MQLLGNSKLDIRLFSDNLIIMVLLSSLIIQVYIDFMEMHGVASSNPTMCMKT